MASQFPSALDDFVNPTTGDTLADVPHADQHANANDAIEAIEAKLGIDDSDDETSIDYRLRAIEAAILVPVQAVPTGTVDGSNVTFTLPSVPAAGTLMFFSDGIFVRGGVGNDYTLSGTTVTLVVPPEYSVFALYFT